MLHFLSCYLMWNLLQAIQSPDMIQCIYGWREATVETEYLFGEERAIRSVHVVMGRLTSEPAGFNPAVILLQQQPAHPCSTETKFNARRRTEN